LLIDFDNYFTKTHIFSIYYFRHMVAVIFLKKNDRVDNRIKKFRYQMNPKWWSMVWRHCEHNKLSLCRLVCTTKIYFSGPTNILDVIENESLCYENIRSRYGASCGIRLASTTGYQYSHSRYSDIGFLWNRPIGGATNIFVAGSGSVKVSKPKLWNSLPDTFRNCVSQRTLKKMVKAFFNH